MDVLVVGRQQKIIDAAQAELQLPDVTVHGATSEATTREVLRREPVQHVFMGPGLDLPVRLKIIQAIFDESDTTCVHMKDFSRGPEGALDFIRGIILGLRAEYHRS